MPNKNFKISEFLKNRPLSWSALSSFEYDPEQWYQNYFLGKKPDPSKEMQFGSRFAKSCENREPLAPVTMLCKMEQPFKIVFNQIPLIGFADSFCENSKKGFIEYKTGKKAWTQERADGHGQITMYALMNYVTNKVTPEECTFVLEWIPTIERGDFTIDFVRPIKVHSFNTKRTTSDILHFGARINKTIKEMEIYVRNHQ